MNYRSIAEKRLGRKLKKGEVVHHKDGNQHNNKPSNLQVCKSNKNHLLIPKKKYTITNNDIAGLITITQNLKITDFKIALQTFFSNRQIDIILKKINTNKLSKTEREMYSRSIKKKLRALANNQLFNIANQMITEL